MRRGILPSLLVIALLLPAAGLQAQRTPIKIGVSVPLSGGNADAGLDELHGAELAATAANAAGGALGRSVAVVSADDACDAQQGVTAARKLADAGVVAVTGYYCSSAAIPASSVLHEAGVALIAAASTNPQLTEQGFGNVFRTIGRDDHQGPFAAGFMLTVLHARRIAIVHDNTVYAKGLAEATRKALAGRPNAQVVFFDAITPGERDFTAVLTRIKEARPDVLYFTGYYPEGGLLAKQFRDLNVPGVFMAGDANNDPTFIKEAGSAAEGVLVTSAPLAQFLPTARRYIATYTQKYGRPPGAFSPYEYDATAIVVDAIRRAHSADRAAVIKAIAATRNFKGVTGTISFTPKGDRVGILYMVLRITNGTFTPYRGG